MKNTIRIFLIALVLIGGVLFFFGVIGCSSSHLTSEERTALKLNGFSPVVDDEDFYVWEKYVYLSGGLYVLLVCVDDHPKGRFEIFVKYRSKDREDMLYSKGPDGKGLHFYDSMSKAMRYANDQIALRERLVQEYDRMGWSLSEGYSTFRDIWVRQRMKEPRCK